MQNLTITVSFDDSVDISNETADTEIIFSNLYYVVKKSIEDMGLSAHNHQIKIKKEE